MPPSYPLKYKISDGNRHVDRAMRTNEIYHRTNEAQSNDGLDRVSWISAYQYHYKEAVDRSGTEKGGYRYCNA